VCLSSLRAGIRIADESLDEAFKEADVDKDGKIEFSEFYTLLTSRLRKTSSEEKLLAAFRTFDPEAKGFIPRQDLIDALTTLGAPLSQKEVWFFFSSLLLFFSFSLLRVLF